METEIKIDKRSKEYKASIAQPVLSEDVKEKQITYVCFIRETGVQLSINGKFLKYIKLSTYAANSATESDYHIAGVVNVVETPNTLDIHMKDGSVCKFPYSSISNYKVS